MFILNHEVDSRDLGGGVTRKVLAYSENLMNVELYFAKGSVGKPHSHSHEQIGYIIYGSFLYQEEGKADKILTTGDSYYVPPNKVHGVVALEDSKLLDVFTPMRKDFV